MNDLNLRRRSGQRAQWADAEHAVPAVQWQSTLPQVARSYMQQAAENPRRFRGKDRDAISLALSVIAEVERDDVSRMIYELLSAQEPWPGLTEPGRLLVALRTLQETADEDYFKQELLKAFEPRDLELDCALTFTSSAGLPAGLLSVLDDQGGSDADTITRLVRSVKPRRWHSDPVEVLMGETHLASTVEIGINQERLSQGLAPVSSAPRRLAYDPREPQQMMDRAASTAQSDVRSAIRNAARPVAEALHRAIYGPDPEPDFAPMAKIARDAARERLMREVHPYTPDWSKSADKKDPGSVWKPTRRGKRVIRRLSAQPLDKVAMTEAVAAVMQGRGTLQDQLNLQVRDKVSAAFSKRCIDANAAASQTATG